MKIAKTCTVISLALAACCLEARPPDGNIIVRGQLTRVMAIGGESTGWVINLQKPAEIAGMHMDSVEVYSADSTQLNALADRQVEATGRISRRRGVERGDRTVLEIASLEPLGGGPEESAETPNLVGTEWQLEDLGGTGVLDRVQATIAFEEGRISGNGSCNRFSGAARISGDAVKFGPLISTRKACPEAVMNQETRYLKALETAERIEWKEPYLLVHSTGLDKPLKYTRLKAQTAASGQELSAGRQ